jgi:hypothetical protein
VTTPAKYTEHLLAGSYEQGELILENNGGEYWLCWRDRQEGREDEMIFVRLEDLLEMRKRLDQVIFDVGNMP